MIRKHYSKQPSPEIQIKYSWPLRLLFLFLFIPFFNCGQTEKTPPSTYVYLPPQYDEVEIKISTDTLHFPLGDDTFNDIKSFNYFKYQEKQFIAFYDRRSETVNIYDFDRRQRVKQIALKPLFKGNKLYKGSAFVKTPDSIFVINKKKIYLLNGKGNLIDRIPFSERIDAMAVIANTTPAVWKGNSLYTGIRTYVSESSLSDIRKWKLLYQFDFEKENSDRLYHLPPAYHQNIYGSDFLEYSYCYNKKGNFVFSFPADSNIYETDLSNYYHHYYGKSRYQSDPILPVKNKTDLENDNGSREFAIRYSYGAIFYDAYHNRYLRLARQKMSAQDYDNKTGHRKQSMIIFDEQFRVIGESQMEPDFSSSFFFITDNGEVYARTNRKDEYAIHFVKLDYSDKKKEQVLLTQNTTQIE